MNKIKEYIEQILEIILPKDKEILEIENMSDVDLINSIPPALDIKNSKYRAMFQYKNRISRKAIWAIKYNKNHKIIKKFSNLLYEYILEDLIEETTFSSFQNPLFVPIPMHKDSLKKRGYNQSELIAKEIFRIDDGKNFDICLTALSKVKATPHQSALKNKNERLKNLRGCFYADEKIVKNRNIILIDDVITTGTTMSEATKSLISAGAKKIVCFSIAH